MSKTSEKAYKTQYAKYLDRYHTLSIQGKIQKVELWDGTVRQMDALGYEGFKRIMDQWVKQNPTENKYTAGSKIALESAQYTKKQYKAFYNQVQADLAKIKASDEQIYTQINQLMKGSYNQQGKWLVSKFEANAYEIMQLYFQWSGSYEIKS